MVNFFIINLSVNLYVVEICCCIHQQTHFDKLCTKIMRGCPNECDKSLQMNLQEVIIDLVVIVHCM